MSAKLDAILADATKRSRRGCAICGKDTEANLYVRLSRLAANGSIGAESKSKARALSFCAEHAVAKWEELTAALGDRS